MADPATIPVTPPAPAPTAAAPPQLRHYAPVVGEPEIDDIQFLARKLARRSLKMVNSTAVGGGVAEMLSRLVPLLAEVGLVTQWETIKGGEDFFAITKSFHNALHGAKYDGRPEWFDRFLAVSEENRQRMRLDHDFIVIHDPQPAGLVRGREAAKNQWIWRCHIDLSNPDPQVWGFLQPMVASYDAAVFSSPAFARSLPIPQFLFYPTIDPLADKNRELDPVFVQEVIAGFKIDPERPIVTQISRFDRLKDPVGVILAYRIVRKYADCQLVLAGGGASDDPEGEMVLREVQEAANGDPDIHILSLPPWSHLEINALQRASTIIVQKSLKEGFGLTVSEGLWKKKPVVASAVGGIPSQVLHKLTGLLVHSVEGCAYQIRFLLSNPTIARRLGENGCEHVRKNFLITQNLKRYLLLFLTLSRART